MQRGHILTSSSAPADGIGAALLIFMRSPRASLQRRREERAKEIRKKNLACQHVACDVPRSPSDLTYSYGFLRFVIPFQHTYSATLSQQLEYRNFSKTPKKFAARGASTTTKRTNFPLDKRIA